MTNHQPFNPPAGPAEAVPAQSEINAAARLPGKASWVYAWHHESAREFFPQRNLRGNPAMDSAADMDATFSSGGNRPVEAGHSSHGHTCPRCNSAVYRVPRRLVDLLMNLFMPVSRYRCHSAGCAWEGNLRLKRRPLLIQGPW
jgi:hypothetical protein